MGRELVAQTATLPVRGEDLEAVDWTVAPPWRESPRVVEGPRATLAWIMSPPSPNSGGHQNLFRFLSFAEKAGYRCRIYFYTSTSVIVDGEGMRRMLAESGNYPDVAASMEMYDASGGVAGDVDAIVATGWETAYPAFRDASRARRLYFVQDYEPSFYPWGTEQLLAENTYRFGFHALTAGRWLSHKLSTEYGMAADPFDFAAERSIYRYENDQRRREIFFYARPSTPRRGFEIGVHALATVARARPETTITMAGEDLGRRDLGFPYQNLAAVDLPTLNRVYNRCAAGLVISASNMSLLPLELLSAGAIPVVNDAPNNRLVSNNPHIEYVPAQPAALARTIIRLIDDPDLPDRAARGAASLQEQTWERSGAQFTSALERALHV